MGIPHSFLLTEKENVMDNLSLAIEQALERVRVLGILKAGNFYYLDEKNKVQHVYKCINPDAYAFNTGAILFRAAFGDEKHYGVCDEVRDTSKLFTANWENYHKLKEKYPDLEFQKPVPDQDFDSNPFDRVLKQKLEANNLVAEPVAIGSFKIPSLEGGFVVQYANNEHLQLTIERLNRRRLNARTMGDDITEKQYYSLLHVVKWLNHVLHT